jgi:lysophospholipase L1-like esterase
MTLAALLGFIVVAAETIVSPVPSDGIVHLPNVSFGKLTQPPAVLGTTTEQEIPRAEPVIEVKKARRNVTIALLGDSMIDTLGPGVPELAQEIASRAAHISPTILNYGVGATNIDYGIQRITNDYEYLGKQIPALASQHPDIVIIESFGYNPYPFDTGALDKHWLALAAAVDSVKKTIPGAQIVIATTVAPDEKRFGDGAAGLAFSAAEKERQARNIRSYLESTIKFAQGQNLPLADAYTDSLDQNGNGREEYINSGDHIHTSEAGRKYFAQKVTEALMAHKLLE